MEGGNEVFDPEYYPITTNDVSFSIRFKNSGTHSISCIHTLYTHALRVVLCLYFGRKYMFRRASTHACLLFLQGPGLQ